VPDRDVVVTHDVGLHARPAAQFVKTATGFQSEIKVHHKDKTANAKSILEVLTLDAGNNARLRLTAEGPDAEDALDALESALSAG
jgi:phosphotransferase system HPr (HPr) family protein